MRVFFFRAVPVFLFVFLNPAFAVINNGDNAINVLGQFTSVDSSVSTYTKGYMNNGAGVSGLGFSGPGGLALDTVNHRQFIVDSTNHRVLVYNLAGDNSFTDKVPDNVLGQANFTSNTPDLTQSGMANPTDVAFDSIHNRLYVADGGNGRVLVYDVATIVNGENAAFVLGQPDFTTYSMTVDKANLMSAFTLALDAGNDRLFVSDFSANRVVVFDVSSLSNGMDAADLLGQYTGSNTSTPNYSKLDYDNQPSPLGFDNPVAAVFDTVHHRLFVADNTNARVLVYNLNADETMPDRDPDYVLGQTSASQRTNYTPDQSSFSSVLGLAYDGVNDRLFVADFFSARVLVFNTSTITNGMNATYVLGQSDFVSTAGALTQAGLSGPRGLAYDSTNSRLFVADTSANRILVFNTTALSNGMNAANVLGQTNFTSNGIAATQSKMNQPYGLAYNANKLYVSDSGYHRVTIFDTTSITDGMNAANVLGQPNFTTVTQSVSQAKMNSPQGVAVDASGSRLFVADTNASRILSYNLAALANGMNASNVLGSAVFNASQTNTTQAGLRMPSGIAFDPTNNRIYVCDSYNYRISIFNTSSITNGMNASDLIGQYSSPNSTTPTYLRGQVNNSGSPMGFAGPWGLALDTVRHRLFVSDGYGRILIFNLNSNSTLPDRDPDYILGHTDFASFPSGSPTAASMSGPSGLAYDLVNDRLYVTDMTFYRVSVFDLSAIANGMNATYVLGQPDFVTTVAAATQSKMNITVAAQIDATNSRLLVSDRDNNRVLIFNTGSLSNGMNASDLIGQYSSTDSSVISYKKNGINNSGAGVLGFRDPNDMCMDPVRHKFFVSDFSNNRVAIYDLNTDNSFPDRQIDNVLGQPDAYTSEPGTSQSTMFGPNFLACDSVNGRLYVSDSQNARTLVFDTTTITDGMNASYVLGQPNFTANSSACTQAVSNRPTGLALDISGNRLFVADDACSRILVYNTAALANGMNASNVLGQTTFFALSTGVTQSKMNRPYGLAYNPVTKRLFVADYMNHRVLAYNVTTITDGMNAVNVFGQANFTATTSSTTATNLAYPRGVAVDSNSNRLFISDTLNARVLMFDLRVVSNGMSATRVLGAPNFTTYSSALTQNRMSFPIGLSLVKETQQLFVMDNHANRILVFDGTYLVPNSLMFGD